MTVILHLSGCGGTRPDLTPWQEDYERTVAEVKALLPASTDSPPILERAAADHTRARALEEEKAYAAAEAAYRRAEAEARVALAWVAALRERNAAAECWRQAADARREWLDALSMLEQVEKVAGRQARGVTRDLPGIPEGSLPGEIAPPFPLDGGDAPGVLERAPELRTEAERLGVAMSDLESIRRRETRRAELPDLAPPVREDHTVTAALAVREMEYRLETARLGGECTRALELVRRFASHRDGALWGMVELERGMKEGVRKELDLERARMEDRQSKLFEALQQFEGKFASIKREARGTIMSLKDILFDFDKATLKRDAEFNLVKVAVILQQFPEMHITIEGHTDNIGTEEYNQKLSERRANTVRDFLREQGIDEARMSWQGFGMSQPVASNATDEGRALNRRVDLVIAEE